MQRLEVPPMKWSILMYGFLEDDRDGKETFTGRDCHEAATS